MMEPVFSAFDSGKHVLPKFRNSGKSLEMRKQIAEVVLNTGRSVAIICRDEDTARVELEWFTDRIPGVSAYQVTQEEDGFRVVAVYVKRDNEGDDS